MNITNLFSKSFLFNPTPDPKGNWFSILLTLFVVLLILGITLSLLREENKKILGRFIAPVTSCSILGLIHVFSRYEGLPWLASRFYLVSIFILLIIWVIISLIWALRYRPIYKNELKTQLRYERYLPKSKR